MGFIAITAAAAGGRFQPSKPVVTHTSQGVFTVTGYATNLTTVNYTFSATGATGFTNNAGAITLNDANSVGSVFAKSKKDGPASPTTTFERKAYSYYTGYTGQYAYTCNCSPNQVATCNGAPPGPPGSPGCGGTSCGCYDGAQHRCICWATGPPYCQTCYGQSQGPKLDLAPASAIPPYTNEFSEWVRLG